MKLTYIHQYFTFPSSSGGTRSYDLSKSFVEKGIDVMIITTSSNINDVSFSKKKRWIYTEREGIKFWILNCPYNQGMPISRRILSFFQFMTYTSIKIITIEADVVLATSTPLTIAIPAILKKIISRTPYIFEVRDVWPEGPIQLGYVKNEFLIKLLRWTEQFIYKHASYLVVLSTGMKECIVSRIPNKKLPPIEVIPNISEINRFSDISHRIDLDIELSGKKIVLYAGTLGPVNHIMYVAELAKMLKEYNLLDIVFLIVGEGNEKIKIMEYCKKQDILNLNIFFVDKVPKQSLPYLYSISTMGSSFVLDKKIKWDNSANKFFDTLAAGKPILINHKGWQADLIETENIGYVLPVSFDENAVKNFVAYINKYELLQLQGKNAKRAATERFSLKIAVNKYLSVFSHF